MIHIPTAPTALHRFAQSQFEGIQHAALLLGGRPWLRRTQSLLRALQGPAELTARIEHEAHALLALLALEHSGDPHSDEAKFSATVDPSSPDLEDLCLLAEALREALAETQIDSAVEAGHV